MLNQTGTRLSAALLGYVILIILLMTLNPFYLAVPEEVSFTFRSDIDNIIRNVLLFIPLGFFYRITLRRGGAFWVGAFVSLCVETAQIFIPARTPSIIDILTNAMGAGVGALGSEVVSSQLTITQGAVSRLRLETPLMGLVYLLVPLLWVNAVSLEESPKRWLLTLLIGLCGAIVFSEIFRHWQETGGRQTGVYAAVAAGLWFLIGVGPAITQPGPVLSIGLVVMLLTTALTSLRQTSSERRFERTTLKRIFPIFGSYLLLLALWHPLRPLASWHATVGFTDQITEKSTQILYPRVEYLVGFTVLGYLLAEWHGRSEIPLSQDTSRLLLLSLGIALALELLVGFQSGPGASLIRAIMVVASALFGGTIYHFLRAHIRFLLGR